LLLTAGEGGARRSCTPSSVCSWRTKRTRAAKTCELIFVFTCLFFSRPHPSCCFRVQICGDHHRYLRDPRPGLRLVARAAQRVALLEARVAEESLEAQRSAVEEGDGEEGATTSDVSSGEGNSFLKWIVGVGSGNDKGKRGLRERTSSSSQSSAHGCVPEGGPEAMPPISQAAALSASSCAGGEGGGGSNGSPHINHSGSASRCAGGEGGDGSNRTPHINHSGSASSDIPSGKNGDSPKHDGINSHRSNEGPTSTRGVSHTTLSGVENRGERVGVERTEELTLTSPTNSNRDRIGT
jgi:hypothetical protein